MRNILLLIAIIFAILVFGTVAYAMPAHPDSPCWQTNSCPKDPDMVSDLPSMVKPQLIDGGLKAPSTDLPNNTLGTMGTQKVVVIPVVFTDFKNKTNLTVVNASLQNLVAYYKELSHDRLNLTIDLKTNGSDWFYLPQNMSYYGYHNNGCANPNGIHQDCGLEPSAYGFGSLVMMIDAVNVSDSTIDFSQYDRLMIVHADQDEAGNTSCTNCIWSVSWSDRGPGYPPLYATGENVTIHKMFTVSEIQSYSTPTMSYGTAAHELAHDIGAFDLYDTVGGSSVFGKWSLMDYGGWLNPPSHIDPWHKLLFNWSFTKPIGPGTSDVITLKETSINNTFAAAPAPGCTQSFTNWSANPGCQYFLVEFRNKTGFDSQVPEAGVVIWHIDNTVINNFAGNNTINAYYPGVVPEDQTPGGNFDDAAYTAGQNFTPLTNPNSSYNNGPSTNITIDKLATTASYVLRINNNDLIAPQINVTSPQNKSYTNLNWIWVNVTLNEDANWCGYSLNGAGNLTMDNTSATSLYKNVSSITDGQNGVGIFCNDTVGNMAASPPTFFTLDKILPSITIIAPANITYNSTNVTLSFVANGTGTNLSWCGYSLDSTANVTLPACANNTISAAHGTHNITVYANDSAGNMNSSDIRYFSVDVTAPTITIVSPSNTTYGTKSVWANVTLSEAGAWCGVFNDTINQTMANSSTAMTAWYVNLSVPSDGSNHVQFFCNDTVGNMGNSSIRYFSVDTQPPTVNITSPLNNSVLSGTRTINFDVIDFNFNTSTLLVDAVPAVPVGSPTCGGTPPNTGCSFLLNTTAYSDGVHVVNATANDTFNYTGASLPMFYTFDKTLPSIIIITPVDNFTATYLTRTGLPLNFTANGTTTNISWCGYSLDSTANVTLPACANTTFNVSSDGTHSIILYANDSAGNMNSSDIRYFSVDTVAPTINVTSPTNTTYGKYTPKWVWANVTLSKTGNWCGVSLNGTANKTMNYTNATTWYYNLTVPSEGSNYVQFFCNDSVGHMATLTPTFFTMDTINPTITLILPANTTYGSTNIALNFTANGTGTALSWCGYSLDLESERHTITGCLNTTFTAAHGDHNIEVYANDSAGLMNSTGIRYFSVDTVAPNIVIVLPQNIEYNYNVSLPLQYVVTDVGTAGVANCSYSLDGAANVTMPACANTTFNVANNGNHTIRVWANDTLGNTNSTARNFSVNTTVSITIMSPIGNYSITNLWFNATAQNMTWCKYSIDAAPNNTMSNDTSMHWYNNSTVVQGLHNVTFFCNNTGGVIGINMGIFRVDQTAPAVTIVAPTSRFYLDGIAINASAIDALTYVASASWRYENASLNGTWSSLSQSGNFWTGTFNSYLVADGNYTIRINATDAVGNSNTSMTVANVAVDNTPPKVLIFGYTNATKKNSNASIALNISVNDTGSGLGNKNCTVAIDAGGGSWAMNTITQTSGWCNDTVALNVPEGNRTISVSIYDAIDNIGSNSSYVVWIDNTPPTILNLTVANITNTSAIIRWWTNENSSTGLLYGTNSSNFTNSTLNVTTNDTYHIVNLTGLMPATGYMFRANSTDAAGNTVIDIIRWFATSSNVQTQINATNTTNFTFNETINGTTQTVVNLTITTNTTVNATISVTVMPNNPTTSNISTPLVIPRYFIVETNDTLNGTVLSWVIIKAFYSDSDLPAGIDESSLRLYRYNETNSTWMQLPGGVDTNANYVWGNSSLLSNFGIGGTLLNGQSCSADNNCSSNLCCYGSCAATCQYGSTGGGGGGGGNVSTTRVTVHRGNATISVPSIAAGKMANVTITKTADETTGVRQISISVKNSVNNIYITITRLDQQPTGVTNVNDRVVSHYLDIAHENITDADINNTIIKFGISKNWFEANNVDRASTRLLRWTGEWTELPTTEVNETDDEVLFSAESPGLSYFAITAQVVGVTPPVIGCPTCDPATEWSDCVNGTQTRTAYSCSATTNYACQGSQESQACGTAVAEESKWSMINAILIFLAAAVVVFAFWKLRK